MSFFIANKWTLVCCHAVLGVSLEQMLMLRFFFQCSVVCILCILCLLPENAHYYCLLLHPVKQKSYSGINEFRSLKTVVVTIAERISSYGDQKEGGGERWGCND